MNLKFFCPIEQIPYFNHKIILRGNEIPVTSKKFVKSSGHPYNHTGKLHSILFFFFLLTFSFFLEAQATIRYVSKTGNSTPPYLTWETAADSIQECINICFNEDTIIIDEGEFNEFLIIDSAITLIGMSMFNTIINGSGIGDYNTIDVKNDLNMRSFTIVGKGINSGMYYTGIATINSNINLSECIIKNCNQGIFVGPSSGIISDVIVTDCQTAVETFCYEDTCRPQILNSVFLVSDGLTAISFFDGGNPIVQNNIVIGPGVNGIRTAYTISTGIVKNNIIMRFTSEAISLGTTDTAEIINNNIGYRVDNYNWGYVLNGSGYKLKNNVIHNTSVGVSEYTNPTSRDYNLYWNNEINIEDGTLNEHEIEANPMFLKDDSIPNHQFNFDYHLQKYSPAIDAGDPAILDKDSSRSDIGYLGGPGGLSYTYLDLPPSSPKGLSISKDTNNITIKWRKNNEADFSYYRLFRDTVINFTVDSTKLITELTDTIYTHIIPPGIGQFYYRLTAVDSQGNESELSEQIGIVLTGVDEWKMVSEYNLFQNYPNPFNPVTKIPYRLKERGYIKLMIYDIKGELIKVLVNREEEAGYYEEEFRAEELSSGIYLYRIEIIGKGRIPVYTDMKKMILLK